MHKKGRDRIVMIEVRFTKVDFNFVDHWVEVTILIQIKSGSKFQIEILEYKLNLAVVWQEPKIYILLC